MRGPGVQFPPAAPFLRRQKKATAPGARASRAQLWNWLFETVADRVEMEVALIFTPRLVVAPPCSCGGGCTVGKVAVVGIAAVRSAVGACGGAPEACCSSSSPAG